ncbi:MAG: TnpV protein [Lachnospiraceae bacterium]|nr:TnpV protein [Lachnospiraceae bacterium]
MNIEYIKNGDYYISNLTMPPQPEEPLLKCGLMHKKYLKEHHRGLYSALRLKGELKAHCLEVQRRAEEQMEKLVTRMADHEGVDEAMKRSDQMKWVKRMNNIHSRAEEIVREHVINTL